LERKRFDVLKERTKMIRLTKKQIAQALEHKGVIVSGKAAVLKKIAENIGTVNEKKGALGSAINEMSLKYLLGNCDNFINEESMLQQYGRFVGVTID
jgi:hypothetical protein